MKNRVSIGVLGCALAWLAAPTTLPARASDALPWQQATQMIVVTADNWDAARGTLRTFERAGDAWVLHDGPMAVTLGVHGVAWGTGLHRATGEGPVKQEGDGRSPAGVFAIGQAFGYAEKADTALPYRGLTASDYCVDVTDSPYYNRLVSTDDVGADAVKGATEPMRRDIHFRGDQAYRLGFVIENNPQRRRGAGSCIFAHEWKSPTSSTAGCTAMSDGAMKQLLAWLDPTRHPVFVLLPRQVYQARWQAWGLPAP